MGAALVMSTTTIALANIDSRPGDDFQLHTILLISDLALIAVIITGADGLRGAIRSWRNHRCVLAGLVLGLTMLPAALAHPSDRGVAAVLRGLAALGIGLCVGAARFDARRLVAGTLAAVTLAQVAVACAQRIANGPIILDEMGEASPIEIGGRYASSGLTVHPYVLAAWCAVAGTALLALSRRPSSGGRLTTAAGVAAFAGIGLTMSRAGALAGVIALSALAFSTLRSDRVSRGAVLAAAVTLALGALANLSGWLSRAGQSGGVDAISSGRGALLRQAWGLLQDNLLTGVGPGRYVLALIERPELVELSRQSPRPVHLTPFLLMVEGGLLVVPGLILLALAIAVACRRGGATAVALTLSMLPFLAFDHLAWSYPQGLVLTGVWLGVLDLLARKEEQEEEPVTALPAAPA